MTDVHSPATRRTDPATIERLLALAMVRTARGRLPPEALTALNSAAKALVEVRQLADLEAHVDIAGLECRSGESIVYVEGRRR